MLPVQELNPDYAESLSNRGLFRQELGDVEGAEADLERVRELGFTD